MDFGIAVDERGWKAADGTSAGAGDMHTCDVTIVKPTRRGGGEASAKLVSTPIT